MMQIDALYLERSFLLLMRESVGTVCAHGGHLVLIRDLLKSLWNSQAWGLSVGGTLPTNRVQMSVWSLLRAPSCHVLSFPCTLCFVCPCLLHLLVLLV